MQLTIFGAARTVTGSMHLLETQKARVLLDCGLYQGKRQEAYERNLKLPFAAKSLNAVVLSHAHLDHVGNLPNLVNDGYDGPIYLTHATADLAKAVLMDSAKIQEHDLAFANQKRARQHLPPMELLYTMNDALQTIKQFVGIGVGRTTTVADGVSVTFHDAGHILGAAISELEVRERRRKTRVVFSGDLGRAQSRIWRTPQTLEGAEVVLMESTYGGREHGPIVENDADLHRIVSETIARGGKLIIPAFAIGRTQEIVYALHRLYNEQRLPKLPIYVDSPLAVNVTGIFRLHPECFNDELRDFIFKEADHDAFGFDQLIYTRSVEESKALNDRHEPLVIISASGMAEGGRVQHHLANNLGDARNTVLFVGYQAENTLGRRLVDGADTVRIYGDEFTVRAQVGMLHSFSGHADHGELVAWARAMNLKKVRDVFLVHGELPSAEALATALRAEGAPRVTIPERGQVFEL
jgi:metallo-beta-lactamase family protein